MNTDTLKEARTAADAEALRETIVWVLDGWYATGPVDWDDFLYRVETYGGVDLGSDTNSPAIKRIRAIVRELRTHG